MLCYVTAQHSTHFHVILHKNKSGDQHDRHDHQYFLVSHMWHYYYFNSKYSFIDLPPTMNNVACAVLEALIAALLLHDADTSRAVSISSGNKDTWVDFVTVQIRLVCSLFCIMAAAVRSALPVQQRAVVEEIVVFVSLVVAMLERAAAGCVEPAAGTCDPVGVAAMVIASLSSLVAWLMACYHSNTTTRTKLRDAAALTRATPTGASLV